MEIIEIEVDYDENIPVKEIRFRLSTTSAKELYDSGFKYFSKFIQVSIETDLNVNQYIETQGKNIFQSMILSEIPDDWILEFKQLNKKFLRWELITQLAKA